MDDELYTRIQTLITEGNLADAEQILDGMEERDARWHYLSNHIYLSKNWTNEARKQLELAIKLDPDNEKYKEELETLKQTAEETFEKAEKKNKKKHLGKGFLDECPEGCAECCTVCGLELCCNLICEGCGG